MVKKQDQYIISLYYKYKRYIYQNNCQLPQSNKKKINIEKDYDQLNQYAQQYNHDFEEYNEIDTFFQGKNTKLYIEKNKQMEVLYIQFNQYVKCAKANISRLNKIFQLKKIDMRLENYNDYIKWISNECKINQIKFEQKTISILDMLHLETSFSDTDSSSNFASQDSVLQLLLLCKEQWKDIIVLPTQITLYKVDDIKKIVFKCYTKLTNGQYLYRTAKLIFDLKLPFVLFKFIDQLPINPEDILFRIDLLKNISLMSFIISQGQLKILAVPPIYNISNTYICDFVYKYLMLNYQKQFTITSLIEQLTFLQIFKLTQQQKFEKNITTKQIFQSLDSSNEAYQQLKELFYQTSEEVQFLIQLTQAPSISILRFMKDYQVETKYTILSLSLLKAGFLSLENPLFENYIQFISNYFNYMHFDTVTTIQGLEEHLVILQQTGDNIQEIYRLIPKINSFTEQEPLSFTMKNIPLYSTLLYDEDGITQESASKYLNLISHEIQHLPNKLYKCILESDIQYLPQILSDVTSLNPFTSNITFQFSEQIGVDAGGMWRQIMTYLFDNLIDQVPITSDVLKEMKKRRKIVRDINFDQINQYMCSNGQLFKVIQDSQRTILCPIYCFYEYKSTAQVYPRITDKRSAIYYLGRLLAYCTIYNAKIPDYFQESFYKILVGGRFYFDDQLKIEYMDEIKKDKMFLINGTKNIYDLQDLSFTEQELNKYYKEEIFVLKDMLNDDWDEDMSGITENMKLFIKIMYNTDLQDEQERKRYVNIQLKGLKSGKAFFKFYNELRLGFRHALQVNGQRQDEDYLARLSKMLDLTLEVLDYNVLKEFMTYKEYDDDTDINKQQIVEDMFTRNFQKLDYQSKYYTMQEEVLERFIYILSQMSYQDITTFIFATTGSRSILNTDVEVDFINENSAEKRFIEFHTCFNKIEIPLEYVYNLNNDELQKYILESSQLALDNGFNIA